MRFVVVEAAMVVGIIGHVHMLICFTGAARRERSARKRSFGGKKNAPVAVDGKIPDPGSYENKSDSSGHG